MTPHMRNLTDMLAQALIWRQHDQAIELRAKIQHLKDQEREDTQGRDVCHIITKNGPDKFHMN